jgi:hypothetical protein
LYLKKKEEIMPRWLVTTMIMMIVIMMTSDAEEWAVGWSPPAVGRVIAIDGDEREGGEKKRRVVRSGVKNLNIE